MPYCYQFFSFLLITLLSLFGLQQSFTQRLSIQQQRQQRPLAFLHGSKRNSIESSKKGFANNDLEKFILPAGTVVKHGTTSDNLESILKWGLRSSGSIGRGFLRDNFEKAPTFAGVYVARSFVAYSSALIGFTAKQYQFMAANRFPTANNAAVPLPIVLNIRLKENCSLLYDEDYYKIDKELQMLYPDAETGSKEYEKAAKKFKKLKEWNSSQSVRSNENNVTKAIWDQYGTGVITRMNGIPASWIESVECPHCLTPQTMAVLKYEGPRTVNWDRMLINGFGSTSHDEEALKDMKMLMEDVYKMVYAYDLSGTQLNTPLQSFEAMQVIEQTDSITYLSPTNRMVVEPLARKISGSLKGDCVAGDSFCRSLVPNLTGNPSNWEIYPLSSTKDVGCGWDDDAMKTFWKNHYAVILNDCIQFSLSRMKLYRRN